jgi:hypothetical protein
MISHLDSSRPQELHRPLRRGMSHPSHDGWAPRLPLHPLTKGPAVPDTSTQPSSN